MARSSMLAAVVAVSGLLLGAVRAMGLDMGCERGRQG